MNFPALLRHETVLALLVIIALATLAALSDRFFTAENLLNQGRLMAEVGLVALGMTFVIVTGGIDLSVGSILGLTAILFGVFWHNVGLPLPIAMVAALASGTLAGVGNGLIVTRFKVPPLIATLATLALYRGLAEGISQARSVRGYPEWFFFFGQMVRERWQSGRCQEIRERPVESSGGKSGKAGALSSSTGSLESLAPSA